MCVQCTVQCGAVIDVYIKQCRVRLLLVCVQCTVRSEAVMSVCTVHSAE